MELNRTKKQDYEVFGKRGRLLQRKGGFEDEKEGCLKTKKEAFRMEGGFQEEKRLLEREGGSYEV